MNKVKEFENELKYIKDESIRKFAEKTIKKLPDYFFEVPASSTGKYHPAYSLGSGGLLRHTRSAIRIAIELFQLMKFSQEEEDLIIVALMFHDGWKHGESHSKWVLSDHPTVAKYQIENIEFDHELSGEQIEFIAGCIHSHMGQWNYDYKTKQEILPKPQSRCQKFVHLADYLASRKCLTMEFDIPVKR